VSVSAPTALAPAAATAAAGEEPATEVSRYVELARTAAAYRRRRTPLPPEGIIYTTPIWTKISLDVPLSMVFHLLISDTDKWCFGKGDLDADMFVF
jgi:hypothetical protein